MDVSIIIINYNTKELTSNCLNSIYAWTKDITFEIILVDNASTDGSAEKIKNEYPLVLLIESKENIGFGRANNLGTERASGKYIFLLNSDTLLLNNAVKIFFDWCENNSNKSIGAVGCYLLDLDKKIVNSYHQFPVISGEIRLLTEAFLKRFNFIRKLFVLRSKKKADHVVNIQTRKVDYIVGADLFIPKSVIDEIGLFDRMFFMYYEETDLQLRMKKNGYERFIISGPEIIHLEGGSPSPSHKKRILIDESKFKYFRKNYSFVKVVLFKKMYQIYRTIECHFTDDYSKNENQQYLGILRKL